MTKLFFAIPTVCFLALAPLQVRADSFGAYSHGDNVVVSPGPAGSGQSAVFQLTSDTSTAGAPGYGGIYWRPTTPLADDSLADLSIDYQYIIGTAGGGAIRFSLWNDAAGNNEAYIYIPNPSPGTWQTTGNEILSTDAIVYSNDFGGCNSPNTGMTWSAFLACASPASPIYTISVDEDGGWSQTGGIQQTDVNNFTVNGQVDAAQAPASVPEPASFALLSSGLLLAGVFTTKLRKAKS